MADPIVSPVTPAEFKALIPSASGSFCEKFQSLLRVFPEKFYDWFVSVYNEDGSFTTDYATMLCEVDCDGSNGNTPDNPSMPAPTGVAASDGSFGDKVRVTWNAVTPPTGINPVTQYRVYRSLATNTDPTMATLIGTTGSGVLLFDDFTVTTGVTYNYWVVATNTSETSNFGGPDVGNSGTAGSDLDAPVIDASTVLYDGLNVIAFPVVDGADGYIVYRSTMMDLSDEAQINTGDETPTEPYTSGYSGNLYLNTKHAEIVYYDIMTIPQRGVVFYYRVKAKRTSPPAFSDFSNTDTGVCSFKPTHTAPVGFSGFINNAGAAIDYSGRTKMYVVLTGTGGGGAGGGPAAGGGGGGGGGIVFGEIAINPASTYTLEYDPDLPSLLNTGNAAHQTDGLGNYDVVLKKDGVEIMRAEGGGPGIYDNAGGGAGGAAGSGSVDTGEVTSSGIIDGRVGKMGLANKGGYSGYAWGSLSRSSTCAHKGGGGSGCSVKSNGSGLSPGAGGAGTDSEDPTIPTWAIGGEGKNGTAYIVLHS